MSITQMNQIEYRPWGSYEVLLDEPNYKVKRIVLNPYERFSLQYHKGREEHWVILPKEIHRATAGPNGLVFIETQTGICKEDDIIRLEDDYGRIDTKQYY